MTRIVDNSKETLARVLGREFRDHSEIAIASVGIWYKGEADLWYYACPIERLPFFPVIVSAFHEILRKWFPLIHSLAHSSEALESSPRGG